MKYILYTGIFFSSLFFLANSGGRADSANAGNTGAPGDQISGGSPVTCQFCHNSAAIQVTLSISLLDLEGNVVSDYIPGETYKVRVMINPAVGNPGGYGFQLIPIRDSNNSDIKGLQNPASNVKISTVNSTGRTYAEHNGVSNSGTFEVEWVAPEAGTGSVTFYSAGNGVNRNGNSVGDGGANSSLKIEEGAPSSANNLPKKAKILLSPNPVIDFASIALPEEISVQTLSIIHQNGSLVLTQAVNNSSRIDLNLSNLSPGTYILLLNDRNGAMVSWEKLVKL
jgi:hypothetical protein